MSRRSAAASSAVMATGGASIKRGLQWFFVFLTLLVAVFGLIWIYTTVEQFLITSSRFVLQEPEGNAAASGFRIEGVRYASQREITNVFSLDFGRSIYLCPIAERRRRLLAVDWVEEASVSRVWPNQITVRVRERKPVAFVQVTAADRSIMSSLIDKDGVLLDPERVKSLTLPVLAGMPETASEKERRARVSRFLDLQKELGSYMDQVSEIDVADPENLKIIQPFQGRGITLMLGNRNYKERVDTFVANADEIRQRMPNAVTLDLRLKGRITVIGPPAAKAAVQPAAAKVSPLKAQTARKGGRKR